MNLIFIAIVRRYKITNRRNLEKIFKKKRYVILRSCENLNKKFNFMSLTISVLKIVRK